MCKKKVSSAARQKQAPSLPSTTIDSDPKQETLAVESLDPVIKNHGQRALTAIVRRNYMKALKMITKSISCHRDSPHLRNVQALVHLCLAEKVAKDSDEKRKHLTDACLSVELAVALLPNSVYFASVLACVHFRLAKINAENWNKVIEVCHNALKIENSTDPGIDQFLEDDEMEKSSKESRIEEQKKKITNYLKKSEHQKKLKSGAKKALNVAKKKDKVDEYNIVWEDVKEQEMRKEQIEAVIREWLALEMRKRHYALENYNNEKTLKYKHFWRSTLSGEEKRGFSRVSIEDLERHVKSLRSHLAVDLLSEAIGFAKDHKTWRYWECCDCHEKFGDCQLYRNHTKELHVVNIDESVLRDNIGCESIEMIENGEWKPVNPDAAIEILNQLESEFKGTCNCDLCNEEGSQENEGFDDEDVSGTDGKEDNVSLTTFMDDKDLRFCDDYKRAKILENIREVFRLLDINKCLARAHLQWAVLYAIDQFRIIIPPSHLMHHGLEYLNVLYLLGAPQLQKILETFKDLARTSGFSEDPVTVRSMNDKLSGDGVYGVRERVFLSRDLLCLHLDERLLRGELNLTNYFDFVADDGSAVGDMCENDVLTDNDDILSWLYSGADIELWTNLRDSQREKAKEVLQIILKEVSQIRKMVATVPDILIKLQAIQEIYSTYLGEIAKREDNTEHVSQLYVNLLSKRQKDLQGNDDKASRAESDVISNVLKDAVEAESLVSLPRGNEDCGEELEIRMLEGFEEKSIRSALQGRELELIKDLAFVYAIILCGAGALQQYELILEKMSVYDYRSIILPLLKSFLQTNLEDLLDKDAMKKYEDATDALLVELALDDEKNKNKSRDSVRQKHDKKKKNKKKKQKRKNLSKDTKSKATDDKEHFQQPQNDTAQVDNPNSEIGDCESSDELNELSDIEERILNEHLDYQKKIEEEAKQNCLAEKRFQANTEKAVCLSLDSFERHYGPSSNLTPRLVLHQYVILQSQWRLRQLQDEFMSRSEIRHTHAGKPCFLCAYHDSFAAMRIASRDIPEQAVVQTSSRKFPVHHFLQEWLSTKDMVDKDFAEIGDSASADELKQQLVVAVRKIVEELDSERRVKNGATEQDLAEGETAVLLKQHNNEERVNIVQAGNDTFLRGVLPTNPNVLETELVNGAIDGFLNVIIQTLWHLTEFQEEFMSRLHQKHKHVGNPCVVCVLYGIFPALSIEPSENQCKSVSSSSLRIALSTSYHDKMIVKEGQMTMRNASELLQVILWSLHESFTMTISDFESECIYKGSLDCMSVGCFVHIIFGMHHYERINCASCSLESRHRKYTSLSLTVDASNLGMMKSKHELSSFDMLLKLAEMNKQLTCDLYERGCGHINQVYHTLWCLPHVLIIVLDWQRDTVGATDISAILSALSSELDISILFQGYEPGNMYFLVSMVSFSGVLHHSICFIYSHKLGKYVLHDEDMKVKVIGSWNDVLAICRAMYLQPLILFYVHKSGKYFREASS